MRTIYLQPVCLCVYVCAPLCVCICMCVLVCAWVCVHMCAYVCMHVCMIMCASVCLCMCMHVFVCACVCWCAATKTVLIVFAHHSPGSFNAAVRDVTVQELEQQGFRVLVSDLYAMKFKADATRDDVIGDLAVPKLSQRCIKRLVNLLQNDQRNLSDLQVLMLRSRLQGS